VLFDIFVNSGVFPRGFEHAPQEAFFGRWYPKFAYEALWWSGLSTDRSPDVINRDTLAQFEF